MLRIAPKTHDELVNWSRWCWLGAWPHPIPASKCGSAEGDFIAPPEWYMNTSDLERASRIRPNERHARKVQEAWESLEGFPRLALKAEYPGNSHEGYRVDRARRMGLTLQQYENNLQIAVIRVEEAFAVRA